MKVSRDVEFRAKGFGYLRTPEKILWALRHEFGAVPLPSRDWIEAHVVRPYQRQRVVHYAQRDAAA